MKIHVEVICSNLQMLVLKKMKIALDITEIVESQLMDILKFKLYV